LRRISNKITFKMDTTTALPDEFFSSSLNNNITNENQNYSDCDFYKVLIFLFTYL